METTSSARETGQNLNIWRLSIARINFWLKKGSLNPLITPQNPIQACRGFADRIIEIYNGDKTPGKGFFEKIFLDDHIPQWENKGGFSHVALYGFYATYAHRLAYANELEALGALPDVSSSSQKHYLFFLFGTVAKIKRVAFFALTTSQAFHVFKDYVDYCFPNQIAKSLLLEDRVKDVKDRWTVGPILASHTWYKEGQSYEDSPDTLEKIFVTFRATMNVASRIFAEIQTLDRSTTIKVTRGSICFYKRAIPIEHFPTLISYLSLVAEGDESGLEGNSSPPPGNFSWLDHLRPVSSHKCILDCRKKAERLLYAAIQDPEAPRSFSLCPKWFMDYRQSNHVTWSYLGPKKMNVQPRIWTEAPATVEILNDIRGKVPDICLEDIPSLFLIFHKASKEVREGFVNTFDGELFLEGQRIFRAYGLWYIPNANYLMLVQENLRELIKGHLISRKHPAHLKYPWVKGKLRKLDLSPFDCKLSDLQKQKGAYLAQDGTILCRNLKAPAFNRMTTFKRFHVAIQILFSDPNRTTINKKDLEGLGILPEKADDILNVLKASHHCIDAKGKVHVPFYEGILEKLQGFLIGFQDYYEEGHYNSLYDTEDGFLVGDTITPYDIELFDIAFLNPKSEDLFLYHVKEGVDGDHMRTVCSQIRNAARKLKAAMSGTSDLVEFYADYVYQKRANDPATRRIQSLYREDDFRNLLRKFFSRPREKIVFVLTFMDNHSPQRFLEEGPEFLKGSSKPEVISSIVSKLEVVAVCRDIRAMGFNFKICQVSRNGEGFEDLAIDPPILDIEELRAQREFSLEEYDFGIERLERQITMGDGNCSFHAVLGVQTDKGYRYQPVGTISMREEFLSKIIPFFQERELNWNNDLITSKFLSLFQGMIGKVLRNELDDNSDLLFLQGLVIENQSIQDCFFSTARDIFAYGGKTPQALLGLLRNHKKTAHKTLKSFYEWLQKENNGAHFLSDIGLYSMLEISEELKVGSYRNQKRALKTLASNLITIFWERWKIVILNPQYYLSDDELALLGIVYQKSIVLLQRGSDYSLCAREICERNPDDRVFVYAEGKHFERCIPFLK